MEGIEHGYDDESRSPIQRKSLDQDGMSSDDDKRTRKLEKQARKEEKRAKKEAKALRRKSEATARLSSENEQPRKAAEPGDALVGGQAESGTWGNPIRLGDAAPVGSAQAGIKATTSANAKSKTKRKADDAMAGQEVGSGNPVRIDQSSAGEQNNGGSAVNLSEAAKPADRSTHARKGKRKRGESKGEGRGNGNGNGDDNGEAKDKTRKKPGSRASAVTKTEVEGAKEAGEKAPTKKNAAAGEGVLSSSSTESQLTTTLSVKSSDKRKRATQPEQQPEPVQQDSLREPRSTSSTPVPTPRSSALSPKYFPVGPVETTTSNADGFRTKSRKSASTPSAAGSSAPKRSKETDDELRRKLRTTDAINAWLAEQWRPLPELARLEGLGIITYVRGKFSPDEKAAIKSHFELFRRVNDLSQSDLVNVIMAKGRFKTGYDKFWVETATVCPGRPIQAVKKYVQREYDPRGNQGPWSKEEDADLKRAYATHPNEWTKIAMTVGRTEQDCRDRYKNDLETRDTRAIGPWTKDEEAKLIEIVRNVNITVGNDPLGHEAPWDIVEERMGGTRSRLQCRKKWQGQLRYSEMGNGQRAFFSKSERPFLVKYISRQHVDSEAAIDWVKLASGIFSGLPTEALRNAYKAMKKSLKLPHDTSFEDTLRAMEKQWPIDSVSGATPKLQSSTKELGRRMAHTTPGNVPSAPIISDESDLDDTGEDYEHLDPVLRSTKKSIKARKKEGRVQESRKKEVAANGGAIKMTSARVSESDSGGAQENAVAHAHRSAAGGDDDEANESEVDDVV